MCRLKYCHSDRYLVTLRCNTTVEILMTVRPSNPADYGSHVSDLFGSVSGIRRLQVLVVDDRDVFYLRRSCDNSIHIINRGSDLLDSIVDPYQIAVLGSAVSNSVRDTFWNVHTIPGACSVCLSPAVISFQLST